MTIGPEERDQVVCLPKGSRFTRGELCHTLCEIHSRTLAQIKAAMNDPSNWVGLVTHSKLEKALQGYIADYPHRLEDGLLPYPDDESWEKVLNDRSRLDVLLIDRDERPVVVECKRDAPSPDDVSQLRGYMRSLVKEKTIRTRRKPRGILVHGGALKLSSAVRKEAAKQPRVEIVSYTLGVSFAVCG